MPLVSNRAILQRQYGSPRTRSVRQYPQPVESFVNLAHCVRCPIRTRFTHFPLVDSTFFKKFVGSRTLSYFFSEILGDVPGDSHHVNPRKHRRACCRGSMLCACPQTPQGLLSSKHNIAAPESPNGLFSNKFERHFAARTPIAARTHIDVLAANWQSAANWRLGCKRAANWRFGCKLAFGLQTGNRQRTGVLAANLQRIGVWAANRQRTGVLAANWRLGCKPAIGSELAFWLQICSELAFWLQNRQRTGVLAANWRLGCKKACDVRP